MSIFVYMAHVCLLSMPSNTEALAIILVCYYRAEITDDLFVGGSGGGIVVLHSGTR